MATSQSSSGVPQGFIIGSAIAFFLGFIPFVSFGAPFLGGLAASYVETWGLIKSIAAGFVIGLISLIPLAIIAVLTIAGTTLSSALEMNLLAGLGVLSGIFGTVYGVAAIIANPFMGMLGGLTLGIYFHLIHRAND